MNVYYVYILIELISRCSVLVRIAYKICKYIAISIGLGYFGEIACRRILYNSIPTYSLPFVSHSGAMF